MKPSLSRAFAPAVAVTLLTAACGTTTQSPGSQSDPYSSRVRPLMATPYPAFQGADCVTLTAPRALVWRLLVGPERAASWLLAGHQGSTPHGARYGKWPTATKGDTLVLDVETENGLRQVELKVLAEVPGQALALQIVKDDADILDKGVAQMTYTFVLEGRHDGTTDMYWAWHYDSDSPFSAALFSMSAQRKGQRWREAGLLTFKALLDAVAALGVPPLHDAPLFEQPLRRR